MASDFISNENLAGTPFSKEVIKSVLKETIKELLFESPDIFSPLLHDLIKENAELRKRLSILEGHLGLDEYGFDDLTENGITPFVSWVSQIYERENIAKSPEDEQIDLIIVELKQRLFLATKDVMNITGLRHYQQARRLMRKVAKKYDGVLLDENKHGRGYRLALKNFKAESVNKVNNDCAERKPGYLNRYKE